MPPQKKPVKQVETIEYRYKNKPKPTMGYILLNALFSTIIFIAIYFFYILQLPRDILQFIFVFLATIISGIIGSAIARMFVMFWDDLAKTSQFYTKTMIAALFYSIILFFGLFAFITARYVDFTTITVAEFLVYMLSQDFLEIVGVLIIIKLLVYLLADFMADKMTFGGGS